VTEPGAALPTAATIRFADAIRAGDRRALARAITLVESGRATDRSRAEELLATLLPQTGGALRIGISGAPGVGKSSLIEAFGLFLVAAGHRIAVLAIDPSSPLSGGSILGDKTRMTELARLPAAFIRPSPAGGTLGGVARRTREAGLLCEAAGFDTIVVETVGVGQSETAVADMVDLFLLVLPPAGGDELQGIKKGIVELADIVLINKADGDLLPAAQRAAAEYRAALQMLRQQDTSWSVPVLLVSALRREGFSALWNEITRFRAAQGTQRLAARRARQGIAWMWREVDAGLRAALEADRGTAALMGQLEAAIVAGTLAPIAAARQILEAFRSSAAAPGNLVPPR
jgi:LAO/AO transport system kinase